MKVAANHVAKESFDLHAEHWTALDKYERLLYDEAKLPSIKLGSNLHTALAEPREQVESFLARIIHG